MYHGYEILSRNMRTCSILLSNEFIQAFPPCCRTEITEKNLVYLSLSLRRQRNSLRKLYLHERRLKCSPRRCLYIVKARALSLLRLCVISRSEIAILSGRGRYARTADHKRHVGKRATPAERRFMASFLMNERCLKIKETAPSGTGCARRSSANNE